MKSAVFVCEGQKRVGHWNEGVGKYIRRLVVVSLRILDCVLTVRT